jgi:urease accessory protein
MSSASFLAALQLADSALPMGRFVHSYGMEAWLGAHGDVEPETLSELVEAVVCEAVAPLDGVLVARAHATGDPAALLALDAAATARRLTPPSRAASQSCGRQLARLAPQLAPGDRLLARFCASVTAGETDGDLPVVSGVLMRALGLTVRDAVLVELRGAAAALLSAAVRLGAMSPVRSQVALARMAHALEDAAEGVLRSDLSATSSTAPELELYAMAHGRADAKLFAT